MGFREALASRSLPVGVAPMGQLPPGVGVWMAERSKALRSGRSLPWRRGFESHFWQTYPLAADSYTDSDTLPYRAVTLPKFFSWTLRVHESLPFHDRKFHLEYQHDITWRKPDKDTATVAWIWEGCSYCIRSAIAQHERWLRLLCISKDGIGLQYLWMGFRNSPEPHSSHKTSYRPPSRGAVHTEGNRETLFRLSALRYQKAPSCPVRLEPRPSDYETDALPKCANEACGPKGQKSEALASRSLPVGVAPMGHSRRAWVRMAERSRRCFRSQSPL